MRSEQSDGVAELARQNQSLRRENEELRAQTAALWASLSELRETVTQLSERVRHVPPPKSDGEQTSTRRDLMRKTGVGALAASAGFALARPAAAGASGLPLEQYMTFDGSPAIPPLDTSVRWARKSTLGQAPGYTHQILSLLAENDEENSYAWPLYVQLKGTNHPDADQGSSQSVGATVRTFQRSQGTPWLVGFHSEGWHGTETPDPNAPAINTEGTTILFNGELYKRVPTGTTIGLNLQNTGWSQNWGGGNGSKAINIQGGPGHGWDTGIQLEGAPEGQTVGTRGIWLQAPYTIGLDMGLNTIRMNGYTPSTGRGGRVLLEGTSVVSLRWNIETACIEFAWGDQVMAYLPFYARNVNLAA